MKISKKKNFFRWILNKHARTIAVYGSVATFVVFYMMTGGTVDSGLAIMDVKVDNQPKDMTTTSKNFTVIGVDKDPSNIEGSEMRSSKVFWSQLRGDRSGSVIQDMLMCHAYAFHNNLVYKGACGRKTKLNLKSKHQELIDALGLSNVLKFGCPPNDGELQERKPYIANDTGTFTKEYIGYLQTLVEYPPKPERRRISIHIRRGDIGPCRPFTRGYHRYLPNRHYLRLIDRYNPQNNSDVVVFSESQSFESFDEFRDKGYKLVLDGSIGDVWKNIISSDVVILSRSSFSLVPAIISKGVVVYTPFWHKPLAEWDVVEDDFVNQTLMDYRNIKQMHCKKKGKKAKL